MKTVKMFLIIACVALVAPAVVQGASLAEARSKIGEAIENPAILTSTIRQLPEADQKSFVAAVNEAIEKMPDSPGTKAETFLKANRAALKGAKNGNLATLLAEVFATVPPEVLPTIVENFSSSLFNRASDASVTFTDEQFTSVAEKTMEKIVARNESADDAAVRDTLASVMFIKASNGSPASLTDNLVAKLPEDVREKAKNEWIPAAVAETPSYESIMDSVAQLPEPVVLPPVSNQFMLESLLADLALSNVGNNTYSDSARGQSGLAMDRGGNDLDLNRLPFVYNKKAIFSGAGTKGEDRKIADGYKWAVDPRTGERIIVPGGVPLDEHGYPVGPGGVIVNPDGPDPIEPRPYQWQSM